jgi:hypothetical protein
MATYFPKPDSDGGWQVVYEHCDGHLVGRNA